MQKMLMMVAICTITWACNSDNQPIPGKYDDGVLVINEGNFTDADGSVTYFQNDSREASQKIFEAENNRPFAGLLQSMADYGLKVWMIDNIGNRIEVVSSVDFQSVGTITENLNSPRYLTGIDEKIFVTNWGPFDEAFALNESFVSVYNANDYSFISRIEVPAGPEQIVQVDGKIYVSSLFTDNISVIDAESNVVIKGISASYGSSGMVSDNNRSIWAACTSGNLVQISSENDQIISTTAIDGLSGKITIHTAGDLIYALTSEFAADFSFTENSVLKIAINNPSAFRKIYEGKNLYGIGTDLTEGGPIYLANSNAFQGNGTILRINSEGGLIDTFKAGRGPNGFIFRD